MCDEPLRQTWSRPPSSNMVAETRYYGTHVSSSPFWECKPLRGFARGEEFHGLFPRHLHTMLHWRNPFTRHIYQRNVSPLRCAHPPIGGVCNRENMRAAWCLCSVTEEPILAHYRAKHASLGHAGKNRSTNMFHHIWSKQMIQYIVRDIMLNCLGPVGSLRLGQEGFRFAPAKCLGVMLVAVFSPSGRARVGCCRCNRFLALYHAPKSGGKCTQPLFA